uniref:Uncharacterized protein n=1 Tax=Triticum urartu TaxID=4572 RepID=A0A8R7U4U1_TRIUA
MICFFLARWHLFYNMENRVNSDIPTFLFTGAKLFALSQRYGNSDHVAVFVNVFFCSSGHIVSTGNDHCQRGWLCLYLTRLPTSCHTLHLDHQGRSSRRRNGRGIQKVCSSSPLSLDFPNMIITHNEDIYSYRKDSKMISTCFSWLFKSSAEWILC